MECVRRGNVFATSEILKPLEETDLLERKRHLR